MQGVVMGQNRVTGKQEKLQLQLSPMAAPDSELRRCPSLKKEARPFAAAAGSFPREGH